MLPNHGGCSCRRREHTNAAYWEKKLNEQIGWTVGSLVELGKLFLEAKSKLKHGLWQQLFESMLGVNEPRVCLQNR